MDGLPYISHVLWIHGKGITSLGCNTYTGIPSIQATDHQNYGSRFCRICKPPNYSQGGVGSDMMYPWPWRGCHPFSDVLLMHMNGLTGMGCSPYKWMPSIQATDLPICEPRADRIICRIPSHPQGGMGYDVRYKWTWMGYHTFHMSCECM